MQSEKRVKKKYPFVREMSSSQQVRIVRELFSTVHRRYDFLNHFFSLGQDLIWRRFAVRRMRFFQTNHFLDVATGTADLAIDAALRHPLIQVTGLDFVGEMMAVGQRKLDRNHLSDRVRLIRGDALNLPFSDNHFDVAGIAFGIRNIPMRLAALKEMTRVIVPGGQVMVLEMHFPTNGPFLWFYSLYLNKILPCTARFFSRNPSAYHYLADSIIHFPAPSAFASLMEEAGLVRIEQYPLTLGIAYLHMGTKQ